eukprot:tig00001339_g8272.t1
MSEHAKVLVGNRTITLEDLVKVSVHNATVVLDTAALEAVRAASKPKSKKGDAPDPASISVAMPSDSIAPPPVAADARLSERQVRAVLFTRLVTFMQARAPVGVAVCEYYADLLNRNILPVLPAVAEDEAVMDALYAATCGAGECTVAGKAAPLKDALAKAGLQRPHLEAAEQAAVKRGTATDPAAALGALVAYSARTLVEVADAVASLSAEALHASSEAFGTAAHDVSRPHRGECDSAGNMRAMVEGSKSVDGTKPDPRAELQSVHATPQYNGPARDLVKSASAAVQVELNSGEGAGPEAAKSKGQQFSAQPLATALSCLQQALAILADAAETRDLIAASREASTFLASGVAPSVASAERRSHYCAAGMQTALAAAAAVEFAHTALSAEAYAAVHSLYAQDLARGVPAEEGAAPAPAPAPAEAAKGEEKKKEKKERRKGGGPLQLGRGSQGLREHVYRAAPVDRVEAAEGVRAIAAALDPLARATAELATGLFSVSQARRKPKIPKGTRDFAPEQMAIREKAFATIHGVFKRHGAVAIDTPVFELKETLTGKYGEESKLIYDLADQGGEICSLRYDLTVPFARYVAMNGVGSIKRYHIARVYRRDNPAMNRGRFREFYQCDLDIAGSYGLMIPDSEILKILTEVLDALDVGRYAVKINHRRLLDAILEIAGVPAAKFRPICSAIDKLDKEPWEAVRAEMVEEKGLAPAVADAIGTFVCLKGEPRALLARLQHEGRFAAHAGGRAALDEMATLFSYLDAFRCLDKFSFDLSLARGLDYYTGVIYEAVFTETDQVGSIAAGGRYDDLVGMFNPSAKQIPAVGVSIGIERIFTIMEQKAKAAGQVRENETEVYVAQIGAGLLEERMRIAAELWAAGVKAEFMYAAEPKLQKQLAAALEGGVPLVVIVGEDELKQGLVKLKDLNARTEEPVPRAEVAQAALKALGRAPK